jgi:hypothetical protein
MTLNINLTRRVRRRKLKDGSIVEQTRYVLNWRDPRTGEREQRFFERQRDAQERRSELIAAYDRGIYSSSSKTVTIADAVAAWLEVKRSTVRQITFNTYAFQSRYVVGPLAPSEARRAIINSGKGRTSKTNSIELLGREKVQELTTRRIRAWHKLLSDEVSIYCANRAMQLLKAALALAAEDHDDAASMDCVPAMNSGDCALEQSSPRPVRTLGGRGPRAACSPRGPSGPCSCAAGAGGPTAGLRGASGGGQLGGAGARPGRWRISRSVDSTNPSGGVVSAPSGRRAAEGVLM